MSAWLHAAEPLATLRSEHHLQGISDHHDSIPQGTACECVRAASLESVGAESSCPAAMNDSVLDILHLARWYFEVQAISSLSLASLTTLAYIVQGYEQQTGLRPEEWREALAEMAKEGSDSFGTSSDPAAARSDQFPPHVREQIESSPTLQNLARVLAYQKRQQRQLPLDQAETAKLHLASADLVECLRTILCL